MQEAVDHVMRTYELMKNLTTEEEQSAESGLLNFSRTNLTTDADLRSTPLSFCVEAEFLGRVGPCVNKDSERSMTRTRTNRGWLELSGTCAKLS